MDNKFFILGLTAIGMITLSQVILSDDDEHENGGGFWTRGADVTPVSDNTYREECGGCHFAYPPGLLPEASWQKIMTSLDDHFGDNAELDPETQGQITDYLAANSAEKSDAKRSRKIVRSLGNNAPMRLTETAYFQRKHDEVPERLVKGNDKVGSFSNCTACHTKAEAGSFSESEIRIAGHGKWDD